MPRRLASASLLPLAQQDASPTNRPSTPKADVKTLSTRSSSRPTFTLLPFELSLTGSSPTSSIGRNAHSFLSGRTARRSRSLSSIVKHGQATPQGPSPLSTAMPNVAAAQVAWSGPWSLVQSGAGRSHCPYGHPLVVLNSLMDRNWKCDGRTQDGGCMSAGMLQMEHARGMERCMERFRCETCDYDLCRNCYEHYALCGLWNAARADREVAVLAMQKDGRALEYAAVELQQDREVVMAAVTNWGLALAYASEELRADREVVLAAMRENTYALKYAVPELWLDRKIGLAAVLAAAREKGGTLESDWEPRANRTIVMAAVSKWGPALAYASEELRADREVVMAAVKTKGTALKYASPELQADRDIVIAAMSQSDKALKYASPELQADKSIIKLARIKKLTRSASGGDLHAEKVLANMNRRLQELDMSADGLLTRIQTEF